MDPSAHGFETRAIHVGQEPDPATGAVTVPVYQTSLFVQSDVDQDREWFYSRTGNPTRAALERCIASLEGATHGFCYGSGVAGMGYVGGSARAWPSAASRASRRTADRRRGSS